MSAFYFNRDLSKMEVEYSMTSQHIETLLSNNKVVEAADECYLWADVVARKLGFSYNKNWKVFKKEYVARFFGSPISVALGSDAASVSRLEEFVRLYRNRNIRMTVHANNEACHSKSTLLTRGLEREMFIEAQKQLNSQDCIVVFPESSNENTICFRCAIADCGQKSLFEGGFGQAYLSFENERGLHPVAAIEWDIEKCILEKTGDDIIKKYLNSLIIKYGNYIVDTARRAIRYIGAEYISVEGYYNFVIEDKPTIVDCDLPFDKVFFGLEKNA
ncbi:MAG: hypothetical protein K2J01_03155 [Clostridiales bacterium]|nr:hypothetical protein [Clostridiales bacterium]